MNSHNTPTAICPDEPMITLAVLADDPGCRATYLQHQDLPDNYMADYSLLAVSVDSLPASVLYLRRAGYHLLEQCWGLQLLLPAASEIPRVLTGLAQAGVRACYSDVADSIYQA